MTSQSATMTGMPDRAAEASVFNPEDLQSKGLLSAIIGWILADPQWLLGLFRRFWPIPHLGGWATVTLYDDVQEVLTATDAFPVPFGDKVRILNGGPNFLLGMADGPDYQRYKAQVWQAFRRDDIDTIVTPMAANLSEEIVGRAHGRLDAVQDLITMVPTLISQHYYGVDIPDKIEFGKWTIAMSTFMFGDPTNNPKIRRCALAAGDRVRPIIDAAIAKEKATPSARETVLARLVRMQADGAEGLTDEVIRAYLIGMITGFVPTNTMAAGHMLQMLFKRPDFMGPTRNAALAGDDARLQRCLFEAMRFKPLNPGPFRAIAKDYTIAAGTSRATTVKAGMQMLAGTQSAMFDPRRIKDPSSFNPDRPSSDYMLFGYGLHWCVGAYIAQAQITQTFKALLKRNNLRPATGKAGRMSQIGPFPAHLVVEFDS